MRYPSFNQAISVLGDRLRQAPLIHTGTWQGVSTAHNPAGATRELLNVFFSAPVTPLLEGLAEDIKPSLPWADIHFSERVSGVPMNPPPSHVLWPHYSDPGRFVHDGLFEACYPERIWPKFARSKYLRTGIEGEYGDLSDVVNLLRRQPLTRQAVLPLFHPDETGNVRNTRTMCSLSYWWIRRDDHLHMTYHLRSCDFAHHLRDDCYLAARLLVWMCQQLDFIPPGDMTVWIGSLHSFVNDVS